MCVKFSVKKRYEGVSFNVISVMRGWVGVQFPEKERYVTLEWPLTGRPDESVVLSTFPSSICIQYWLDYPASAGIVAA